MEENLYWETLSVLLQDKSLEEKLDILRRFTKSSQKEIEKTNLLLPKLFEALSLLAEAVLRGSYETALEQLLHDSPPPTGPFAIVGMGKLGGREMTYYSDLDIIYFLKNPQDQEFYTRLGQRIISYLTLLTREGFAYQIDTALRPSGRSGTLVSTVSAFKEYHEKSSQTWEKQALIKARALVGDCSFMNEVQEVITLIAYQVVDRQQVVHDMNRLRKRMELEIGREKQGRYHLKVGYGGLVDIEFMIQFLQIIDGKKNPSLQTPNTLLAIKNLRHEKILKADLAKELEDAYLFYRQLETKLRLSLGHSTDELSEGVLSASELAGYLKIRERVRSLYERIVS